MPSLEQARLNGQHRNEIKLEAVALDEKIALVYSRLKNYDEAIKYYQKALQLDPRHPTLYKGLADVYYLLGNLDRAIALNQRGLMLNPVDFHWNLSLSLLYREKNDLPRARQYLSQALKLAPGNEELKKYQQELNR